jgi:hypothetical protein
MCTQTFVYIDKNTFIGSYRCISKTNLCTFKKVIELKKFRSKHLSRHSDLCSSTFQNFHFHISIQIYIFKKYFHERFQDGGWREEAESMLPKIESWRDTEDTHYRKNHQEEAKL